MSDRLTQLEQWLDQLGYHDYQLTPASADASFRSYLRLTAADETRVIMDAPPDREPCDSFIAVAQKLRNAGLNAPRIVASNLDQGFLLLSDFGSDDYLSQLAPENEGLLYADALAALLAMQTRIETGDLPDYDAALLNQELDLFHDWFFGKLLDISLDSDQQEIWRSTRRALVANALEQPQVFVHRDYHSRNLMKLDRDNPGILDFQDAVNGPVTYDLVSLLRDCYIAWPVQRVDQLALEYYESICGAGLVEVEVAQFMRWFNLMGIQRHLKAIGIFSRLNIRDGKPGYLKDIPRTLAYVSQVSATEESMTGLSSLIEQLELERRFETLDSRVNAS